MPAPSDIQAALKRLEWALAQAPADSQLSVLKKEIAKLPADIRPIVEDCVLMGIKAQQLQGEADQEAKRERSRKIQGVLAGASGAAFLLLLIGIALFVPNPSPFQYIIFRIVLALAAGAFAALIPGFLQVTISTWLRAGGALAVFVIVFFWNPAQLATGGTATSPQSLPTIVPQRP